MGADAVEPDLVASRDGVLVIRHENEISGTTDVASRPEFADRRTSRVVDGTRLTGWFTEDFAWEELATLTTRERLPRIRPANTAYDGAERMLRLEDLLALLDEGRGARVSLVAELKHPGYFRSIGLPLETLLADALPTAGWDDPAHTARLTIESFELSALTGSTARSIYLLEAEGAPVDRADVPYASTLTSAGLADLDGVVDGVSVNKQVLLDLDAAGATSLVDRVHSAGLLLYAWTLRAENRFLAGRFRSGGGPSAFGNWRDEFSFLLDTGLDGVFADQPDLAVEARIAAGVRRPAARAE